MSSFKILFIGDIVGSSGRKALSKHLGSIKRELGVNFCIANGENAAHGFGLTLSTANEIYSAGVDFITGGNHIWDKKEVVEVLQIYENKIIRPANYPAASPGKGSAIALVDDLKIGVVNLMGRVFMDALDCPFHALDKELENLGPVDFSLVDFHAETTSEKAAMGHYADGRVSAVVGTHTHVQTADERILPKATAFLTDAGMTGPYHSIIGMKTEIILRRFVEKRPHKMEVEEGLGIIQGVCFEFDRSSKSCLSIQRIQKRDE